MVSLAFRLSGLLLVAGAALLGVAIVIISLNPVIDRPLPAGASRLLLLSALLLLLSLPAMYARQAHAAGWLGLAGHALLQAGMLVLILSAAPAILYPAIQAPQGENWVFFLLAIALTLGLLLTGIATLRAGVYPRWAGILLLCATAGFFFDFFVAEFLPPLAGQIGNAAFGALLALAFAWVGVALWLGSAAAAIGTAVTAN